MVVTEPWHDMVIDTMAVWILTINLSCLNFSVTSSLISLPHGQCFKVYLLKTHNQIISLLCSKAYKAQSSNPKVLQVHSMNMRCSTIHPWASPVPQWKNNPPAHVEAGPIPRSERSPGSGSGNPLQYSCLGNPRTGEPRGLQSVGLPWAEHDWAHTGSTLTSGSPLLISCSICSVSTGCVVLPFPQEW